jgi:hypothetical protein
MKESKISIGCHSMRYYEATDRASSNVTLFHLPEPIAIRVRLVYLPERDVHKVIAVDKMTIESLAVFQLYQLDYSRSIRN